MIFTNYNAKSTATTMTIRMPIFILLSSLLILTLSGCEQGTPKNDITEWPTVENCDLNLTTCQSKMGDATVSLKIIPTPIPVAKPLGIAVSINGIESTEVMLDISGDNMYMGYNRITLSPEPTKGSYVGTSMLAFCTHQKMQWKLTVMIQQANQVMLHVPFLLETVQPKQD